MAPKLYKIRQISTGKFLSLGYNRKSSWRNWPTSVMEHNSYPYVTKGLNCISPADLEVVEYELKETNTYTLSKELKTTVK